MGVCYDLHDVVHYDIFPMRLVQYVTFFISKSASLKIYNFIENTPDWVYWVLTVLSGLLGIFAVLGGWGSGSGLALLFTITGVPLLLMLFYRICQYIQKKVATLAAG
jgi:hypothetical protein